MATEAAVRLGKNRKPLTIRLSAASKFSLHVKVVDSNGAIVPTGLVELTVMNGRFGVGAGEHRVDGNGVVIFDALWADTHYFLDGFAEHYGVTQAKVDIPPQGDPRSATVTLVLKKADRQIGGVVVDAAGKGIADVEVGINGSETGVRQTKSDAHGHFSFEVVDGVRGATVFLTKPADEQAKSTVQANAGDVNLRMITTAPEK